MARPRTAETHRKILPGMFVEDERTNQRGTVVVPSIACLADMPNKDAVYVRWYINQRETWVEANRLRRIQHL